MAKEKEHRTHYEDIFIKITRKIEHFIIKYIKIIAISLSSVALLLALYFTTDFMIRKKEQKAQGAFDKVYLIYREIAEESNDTDEEKNKELIEVVDEFKSVMNDHQRSKAAAKSAFYTGKILYDRGEYMEAADYFERGSSIKSKHYISLLCLQRLASTYQQLNEYEKAIEVYNRIENQFSDDYIVPTVIYNRGQLYEKTNRFEKARDEYTRIITDFPWSSWKELAEKRQLLIKNFI